MKLYKVSNKTEVIGEVVINMGGCLKAEDLAHKAYHARRGRATLAALKQASKYEMDFEYVNVRLNLIKTVSHHLFGDVYFDIIGVKRGKTIKRKAG